MFIATLMDHSRSTEESSTEIQRRFGFVRLDTTVFGEDEPGGYGETECNRAEESEDPALQRECVLKLSIARLRLSKAFQTCPSDCPG